MMSSMAVQSGISLCSSFTSQKTNFSHFKTTAVRSQPRSNLITVSPRNILNQRTKPMSRNQRFVSLASPEALLAETAIDSTETPQEVPAAQETEETSKVVVIPNEKPRLVLKFIWMEKNIGLAIDQQVPGHGTIPLSPYFFWPRKDAWEELKTALENKPWISQKKMIILLNQATDIINLWQQSGGNITSQ